MVIHERESGKKVMAWVEQVAVSELRTFRKREFWFDWTTEANHEVYKLVTKSAIVHGLISLKLIHDEQRIQINLLSVTKENRGKEGKYQGVAGALIAFTCRLAIKNYGTFGCVSLIPKTSIKKHYMEKYGMLDAGRQVFLEGESLLRMIKKYEL